MKLSLPQALKKGDTMGFISPSVGLAPFAMHRIEKAKTYLESLGYKVKIGKHALESSGYVSASAQKRAEDLNEMFRLKDVAMIMATIGGNHSNQILKYIDFGMIRKNPKIFMGYSDITVLHYALYTQANLATYYGPAAMTQFGENPSILGYSLRYFKRAISESGTGAVVNFKPSKRWTDEVLDWFAKKDLKRPRKLKKNPGYKWLRAGHSSGEIFGGAIPSINYLAGTKYWIEPDGKILFLDIPEGHKFDEGLSLSDVDCYLSNLDNLGVFDQINGLIVGRLFNYKNEDKKIFGEIILKYTSGKNYPILLNVDLGHTDPIITIRYGAKVELDSKKDLFWMYL